MKFPKIVTGNPVKIEKLVPGGQGIATTKEGIKGFFWNALPGETVTEYEITKKKSHYFEAVALKIENPSDRRIEPKDSCYLSTSPWQIMDYDFELEQKAFLLEEVFKQQGITANQLFYVATNNKDFFYRNKMEYSLYYDYEDKKLHLGFHLRGTHRKIKVETSSIERPELFEKAQEIVNDLNEKHADGRNYQSLLLRCNQNGEVKGGLYENRKPHPVFKNLTDTVLGKTYSYSPNGFFQINLPVYEMALQEIKKHIKTENVLDLYAGVGTIGLSVASDKHLTLVEVDKSAYSELERNCVQVKASEGKPFSDDVLPANEKMYIPDDPDGFARRAVPPAVQRMTFSSETGATEKAFTSLANSNCIRPVLARAEETTDFISPDQTVIVDPPRAGLDSKLIEKLLEVMPETIVYLSCNPATQARDLEFLLEKYQFKTIRPFNFFPRTPHLENLVVLNRK